MRMHAHANAYTITTVADFKIIPDTFWKN